MMYHRAARTNLIIKNTSYLQYLMMKPFAMGCFWQSGCLEMLAGAELR